MKARTPANAMRTIRLVFEEFFCPFEFPELDPSEVEGPSSVFPRFFSVAGGGIPKNGRVGAGFVGAIDGDIDGAVALELNEFPSFLHHQFKHQLKKT